MPIETFTKLESLIKPILLDQGLELVDLEMVQQGSLTILRITIDKDPAVSLEDCATLSRKLSFILDTEDEGTSKYNLEVSSPGIFRELKKTKDFTLALEKRVKVKLKENLDNEYLFFGILKSIDDHNIILKNEKGDTNIEIPRDKLKKVSLAPHI